jgi:hypothetical protein
VILILFICLAYLGIAAISAKATVVPDTGLEWARIAVLTTLALAAQWWGRVSATQRIVQRARTVLREASSERAAS